MTRTWKRGEHVWGIPKGHHSLLPGWCLLFADQLGGSWTFVEFCDDRETLMTHAVVHSMLNPGVQYDVVNISELC